jgi:MFS family permease
MISLIDIAYKGVMPLFYSTPISLGGLGLSPASIGICLAIYGILGGLFQVLCFAPITNRYGGKRVLVFSLAMGFPIFALFPLMSAWTKHYGYITPAVYGMIFLQIFFSTLFGMSYGTTFLLLHPLNSENISLT